MRAVVMVPGLVSDDDIFAPQAAGLSEVATVQVADITTPRTVAAMADAVLASAPDRFALVGHSLGGYVAIEVVRRAPGRVEALALLDTSARPESPRQTARRRELLALLSDQGYDALLASLWPFEVAPGRVGDALLRRRMDAMMLRTGPEVFVRQTDAIIGRPDSRPHLAQVDCPTLVLCGREDAITPLDGHEELAAGIAGAQLVVLDDCGHLSTWEQPDGVERALRGWLAR
jgi:pimeloyl-ACP methyl ester carboxylesterase